jgi:hypothetical protein
MVRTMVPGMLIPPVAVGVWVSMLVLIIMLPSTVQVLTLLLLILILGPLVLALVLTLILALVVRRPMRLPVRFITVARRNILLVVADLQPRAVVCSRTAALAHRDTAGSAFEELVAVAGVRPGGADIALGCSGCGGG